ncbi:hypothetical protein MSSAC_1695 [Methanosarcina siciliae C2J]|uniref:Uncharacterized protein n=3 Tax=Methanosarcina siciliae TaxID=38027 RepID=A0A0E3PD04_9EURY|nr:hypothetical protein [Methanosarcina siciliae]AKB28065.1 hypothetical protein MSSIT_1346 [Methanosarcina siciliae T4/M]AKB31982.1 hypothetical protein MSSIH_1292 [Methanosarcina siciliae HI350]AKB36285.1 hypothetical protein MSSAC_1695 [Methanosarcina siciliae C2J]
MKVLIKCIFSIIESPDMMQAEINYYLSLQHMETGFCRDLNFSVNFKINFSIKIYPPPYSPDNEAMI